MQTELAVIGAGPAGMAAAEAAAEHGASVTVIDEQAAAGGQFLRQPPAEFAVSGWLEAAPYRAAKKLLQRVSARQDCDWILRSSVAGVLVTGDEGSAERFTLVIDAADGGVRRLRARALVIAPGCFDLPVVFPGWNLPGVMSAGGIQAFVKSQQFVPGERFLFAGSHPLQLVVADQIVQAGGSVAGVLFAQAAGRALALLRHPSVVLRNAGKLGQTAAILRRLRAACVPVSFNRTLLRANGQDGLQSVTTVPVGPAGRLGREAAEDIGCDRLGVCFGFLTSSELARQAGVACAWDAASGGWIAQHDENMASNVAGIFVAGEITGIAGSDVAALEGRLSGIAGAAWLGHIDPVQTARLAAAPRRALRRRNRFARLLSRLAWPGTGLFDELMAATATLCKCEELTVADLKTLLRRHPDIRNASSAKLLSRAGMGLCQGRYCQFALTRLLARQLGLPESEVGGFTARFPAKPVLIENLIGGAPEQRDRQDLERR